MKRMKKILALTLAVVMTMAMSVTVFASGDTGNDPTGYTITVDGSDKLNNIHTRHIRYSKVPYRTAS